MTLIDEFTRECLAIKVARRINSFGVIAVAYFGKKGLGIKRRSAILPQSASSARQLSLA